MMIKLTKAPSPSSGLGYFTVGKSGSGLIWKKLVYFNCQDILWIKTFWWHTFVLFNIVDIFFKVSTIAFIT